MCPLCYHSGGSLLHCLSTLTPQNGAVYFCCTGLGVTSTGRYPASCPVKPGLSSSGPFRLSSRDHLAWLRTCYFNTGYVFLCLLHGNPSKCICHRTCQNDHSKDRAKIFDHTTNILLLRKLFPFLTSSSIFYANYSGYK